MKSTGSCHGFILLLQMSHISCNVWIYVNVWSNLHGPECIRHVKSGRVQTEHEIYVLPLTVSSYHDSFWLQDSSDRRLREREYQATKYKGGEEGAERQRMAPTCRSQWT